MNVNSCQQLFPTLHTTNMALAASIVAAATAANSTTNESEKQKELVNNISSNKRKREPADLSQLPPEALKREIMNQKIRADNRERKKRWRQQNEERNKDNDLRCRVNKRAHKLFGKEDNEHKRAWIEEEFKRRQQKRKEKERRKGMIDNTLGAAYAQQDSLNSPHQPFLSPQQGQQPLPDINYLTMLCNSLGISGAARALIGNAAALSSHTTTTVTASVGSSLDYSSPSENDDTLKPVTKEEELEAQTNHESLENINSSITTENITNSAQSSSPSLAEEDNKSSKTDLSDNNDTKEVDKDQIKAITSLQLLEFLQHIQQYQPQQHSISSNELAALPTFSDLDTIRPEEKLAALLTSTLQAANNNVKQEGSQRPAIGEFPLDAVLTLMQLNAGWRQ
ncbi:hypothetical protein G6F50_006313 [Rhizopus delemar]|nr:hypothetical protein G6F50_006313 [Rhizopus delemar]